MTPDVSMTLGSMRRDWIIRLAVAALASVIVATLGPFATYENYTFLDRLLYWGGLIMGLVLPAHLVRSSVYRMYSGRALHVDLAATVALSLVIGPVVWAFNRYIMGFDVASALYFIEHIGIVALICLVPVAIRAYLRVKLQEMQSGARVAVAPAPAMTEDQVAFLRRLDPKKRGYVRRVSADNHQVEVWTDQGASKLRLRFGDVLEELTAFDGARIHRSHWVAYDCIESVVPDGRRHVLKMNCGGRLPVSKNGVKALQEAGVPVQNRPNT